MAYTNIDHSRPLGSEKGNILDDAVRETRLWAKQVFSEISGFPDIVAVIMPRWSTAERPVGALKENLMGYNSETKSIETVQDSAWTRLPLIAIDSDTVSGGVRVTISSTAPTSPVINKELWFDLTEEVIKIYISTGWKRWGAAYK